MLGHLAAQERAPRLTAPLSDAGHDCAHQVAVELADRYVVEEVERLGAGDEDVVRAHRDKVDAHGVVHPEELCEHKLRAHAVRAGDEYRFLHLLECRCGEHAAETADVADDLEAVGAPYALADALDGARALGGVHAGVAVGGGAGGLVSHGRMIAGAPARERRGLLVEIAGVAYLILSTA